MSSRIALRLICTGVIAFGLILIGTGGSNFAFEFNSWSMWLTVLGLGLLMATYPWLSFLLLLAAVVALIMVPLNLSGGSWGIWLLLSGIFLILGLAGIVAGNWDSNETPPSTPREDDTSTPQATAPATESWKASGAEPSEQQFHSSSATSRVLADGRDATARLRKVLNASDPASLIQKSSSQAEVTVKFCTDCGHPREGNSKFCTDCGMELNPPPN